MWITHAGLIYRFTVPRWLRGTDGTFQWQNARVAEQNQWGLRSLQIQLLRRQVFLPPVIATMVVRKSYYFFGENSLANHEVT